MNKGGTGATTTKGAEYNLIGAVEQLSNVDLSDSRFFAIQNQTVSASDGTFRWYPLTKLWNYIKDKIATDTLIDGTITNAKRLNPIFSVRNSYGSIVYYKISGMMKAYVDTVFLLQSRAGELIVISCGHDDGKTLFAPKIKRLLNVYSKIGGFSYNGDNVYMQVAGYSHDCILTQIAGNDIPNISITSATQEEYSAGTQITIET